jgi:acyl carrier protein
MMDTIGYRKLRDFLQHSLGAAGDGDGFSDDSPLFSSGRLDSLTMTRLVMFLEDAFGIDFADVDFDVELIDSVDAIQALVDDLSARRPQGLAR